ncbi:hypothetical protein LIER_13914 [Lithospermum erythrorhizon]|uniref:Uncharacterized protein n=1 Tax=Lithospermum erythrorhizon TaxID=34254 RepID=A0AAV3PX83_LITER
MVLQLPMSDTLNNKSQVPLLLYFAREPSSNQKKRKKEKEEKNTKKIIVLSCLSNSWLAFWRLGHPHWTLVQQHHLDYLYFDIALICNTTNAIHSLRIVGRFDLVEVHSWAIQVSCITQDDEDSYVHSTRLVLHQITAQILQNTRMTSTPAGSFWICKQLHSFNGPALLLAYTSSIFVSSNHKYPSNSIYFVTW